MQLNLNSLWLALVPFGAFLGGYGLLSLLVRADAFPTPTLVGQSLVDAVMQLSARQLNLRVIAQREDAKVATGTILDQIPAPGQKIKSHQPVFIVVSRQPARMPAPQLYGLEQRGAEGRAQALGIRLKTHELPSKEPARTVIAQTPPTGSELPVPRVMTIYVSTGKLARLNIMPVLVERPLKSVERWLKSQNIRFTNSGETGRNTVVVSQKPLPGSLVDPADKSLSIQLSASAPTPTL